MSCRKRLESRGAPNTDSFLQENFVLGSIGRVGWARKAKGRVLQSWRPEETKTSQSKYLQQTIQICKDRGVPEPCSGLHFVCLTGRSKAWWKTILTSVSSFFYTQSPVRSQNYEPREECENVTDRKKSRQ